MNSKFQPSIEKHFKQTSFPYRRPHGPDYLALIGPSMWTLTKTRELFICYYF